MLNTVTLTIQLKDWAGWIAQDRNGTWYQFQLEPSSYDFGDDTAYWGRDDDDEGEIAIICLGTPNPSWKETLKEIKND